MAYPKSFIRGMANDDCFDAYGGIKSTVFTAGFKDRSNDNIMELSIDWYDNESAMENILQRTKSNGNIQFKAGVIVVDKDALDFVENLPTLNVKNNAGQSHALFGYERAPIDTDEFHGNILLEKLPNNADDKDKKYMVACILTARITLIKKRKLNDDGTYKIIDCLG